MKFRITFAKSLQIALLIITMCLNVIGQTSLDNNNALYEVNNALNKRTVDKIIDLGKEYLGKPYRYKLSNGQVFDCSGFINYIYGQNGIEIPRTSASISLATEKVSLTEAKKGDLFFFKGRNINSQRIGHISMVTSVIGDTIEMMHSCRRGVIVEYYNSNSYYTSRLLSAGRLPQLDAYDDTLKKISIEGDSLKVVEDSLNVSTLDSNEVRKVKIIGVGDMMLGTNFPNSNYLPPNDGKDILQPVKHIISKGDVSFGNLEGVILTEKGTVKKCSDPKYCYAFKMPNHYVDYFKDAGFNLVSIANNHVRDFGKIGTDNTVKVLNESGIHYAGLLDYPYTTFQKDSLTYGFAAFSPNTGTVRINNYKDAKRIVSHLDSICDIVIVSFHGGAEGSTKNHITRKKEIFLGEDRGNPYEFARLVIDAGADVVFGHGPHVTRAIDIYKDRFISYSMGNFATYARFNLRGPNGVAPIIELNVDENGQFLNGNIHSIKQIGEGGPRMDENQGALKEIIKLTKADIPESRLIINQDGSFTQKVE